MSVFDEKFANENLLFANKVLLMLKLNSKFNRIYATTIGNDFYAQSTAKTSSNHQTTQNRNDFHLAENRFIVDSIFPFVGIYSAHAN